MHSAHIVHLALPLAVGDYLAQVGQSWSDDIEDGVRLIRKVATIDKSRAKWIEMLKSHFGVN